MTTAMRKVLPVTDESEGAAVLRRRESLGFNRADFAREAGVHRNTLRKLEQDDPSVEPLTKRRVMTTLERLEHRYGMDNPDEIVNVVELPDGTRVTFTGSPEGVAEAAARFLEGRRNTKP